MAASAGGVLFLAWLLVAGLAGIFFFEGILFSEISVSEYAESIGEQLQFDGDGRPVAVDLEPMPWLYDSLGREVTFRVLNEAGAVLLASEPGAPPLTAPGEPLVIDDHNFVFERDGILMHGATESVTRDGRTFFVQFAMSERLSKMLRNYVGEPLFSRTFLIFCLASVLVYFLVAGSTLRVILKPLNQASALAARITPRHLGARLQVDGVPSEMRPLVENFNAALDRLEHNYRLQQDFLASAAHELKTPLTLIRTQIELGLDETSRPDLLRDVSQMGRQVQQLLHLAEASEVRNYDFAAVDAERLACEVASYLERLAHQQGVTLQVMVESGSRLARADHGALFTLLKNLLENAIQHSPPGGRVRLRVDSKVVAVQDEGEGVSPEDLPKLFTRFWRGPQRRDLGAGLGLSICREIATMHGWILQARRGEPGMIFELEHGDDA